MMPSTEYNKLKKVTTLTPLNKPHYHGRATVTDDGLIIIYSFLPQIAEKILAEITKETPQNAT